MMYYTNPDLIEIKAYILLLSISSQIYQVKLKVEYVCNIELCRNLFVSQTSNLQLKRMVNGTENKVKDLVAKKRKKIPIKPFNL